MLYPKAGTDESHHCLSPQAENTGFDPFLTTPSGNTISGAFFIACSEGFTHQQAVFFLGSLDVEQFLVALYCAKLRRPSCSRSESVDEIIGMAIQVEGVLL